TWRKHDPHARARVVLDPRQSEIAKRMSTSEKLISQYGALEKAQACLACHGMDTNVKDKLGSKQFVDNVDEGINCLGCHGRAEAWQGEHYGSKDWRKIPYDDSK